MITPLTEIEITEIELAFGGQDARSRQAARSMNGEEYNIFIKQLDAVEKFHADIIRKLRLQLGFKNEQNVGGQLRPVRTSIPAGMDAHVRVNYTRESDMRQIRHALREAHVTCRGRIYYESYPFHEVYRIWNAAELPGDEKRREQFVRLLEKTFGDRLLVARLAQRPSKTQNDAHSFIIQLRKSSEVALPAPGTSTTE